jgi:hypothetical protein
MTFPSDVRDTEWTDNLKKWQATDVRQIDGHLNGQNYSVSLLPLEAKALHVVGLLVRTFDAAGHLLHFCETEQPFGDYYLQAFLLICSAIELFGRCINGDKDLVSGSGRALIAGFETIFTEKKIVLNDKTYSMDELVALRNLAAHGQGVASVNRKSVPVFLHVELLDKFPQYIKIAFDNYYRELFFSNNIDNRLSLAKSGIEPVHY